MLLKLGESHFLKTKYIPAGEHQFFRYFQQFDIFDIFFKVEELFHIMKTYFSTNPSSGKWKQIFCLVETVFFHQSYFSTSGSHYWN